MDRLQLESLELGDYTFSLDIYINKLIFALTDLDVSDFFGLRCDDRNHRHQYKFFLP